uniref:non-specific serine/threonine protein kinase n=1 Tax=Phytophthora fragariae TaxID=53985 RepID=A0A6A3F4X0_9STRA|nr:hypothetical protein PF009_g10746 [Phytophthora fragariae]
MESLTEEQRALFADGGQLDDYEVLKPIGKGKFSVVFKAKRRRDGQAVALKKIAIFDLMNLKAREKTLKEVRLVQSVSHSNIIQYLDAFVQNNELYIAFEWAEAGDLKRQIRKANEKGHDSSPIVVAQKILLAAEKVGVPEVAQLSAPALSSGVGIEVCELLDALTTAVMMKGNKIPVATGLENQQPHSIPKTMAYSRVLQDKLHHRPAESSWRVRLDQVQTHAGAIVAGQEDMRNEISQIQASRQQQTDQLKRYEKMLNNRFLRARRLYDEGTTRLSKAQSVMQCAQENVNHATVEVARLQAARSEQANALKAADARLTDNSKLLERKRQIRHLKNENRELGLKLQVLQDYWNRKQQHATQRRIRQSPQV